ncbi:hypothetical protein G6F66_014195 [Rhizopus arrhizus]|nr:hypothetical protein G6F66_014195 [Rhizopus arrhizus]
MWPRPPRPITPTFWPGPTFQWRSGDQIEGVGHLHHEALLDHHVVGIAAVGRCTALAFAAVVGPGRAFGAVLLQVVLAGVAVAARVDHAADAGVVADLETGDVAADFGHAADDLVARHHRVDRATPVVAGLVQVGVADAAVEDVDQHIVVAGFAPGETERNERGIGAVGGVASGLDHDGLE